VEVDVLVWWWWCVQVERSNVKNEGMRAVLEREANAQRLVQLQVGRPAPQAAASAGRPRVGLS
jgi:hypothetical protein